MSDILNAPVYTQDVANSASLGAAYQAARGKTWFSVLYTERTEGINVILMIYLFSNNLFCFIDKIKQWFVWLENRRKKKQIKQKMTYYIKYKETKRKKKMATHKVNI